MNLWFSSVLAIAAMFLPIGSCKINVKDIILASYKNQTEMREEYTKLRDTDSCYENIHLGLEKDLKIMISEKMVDIQNEIKYGDSDEKIGYYLIVDKSTTIDTPAVIKCISKLKTDQSEHVYYLIIFKYHSEIYFRRVHPAKKTNKLKSTFILNTAENDN